MSSTTGNGYRLIWRTSDLEKVQIGEKVNLLGGYEVQWDEDCLKPADLEPWRFEGDELCDEVVRALNLRAGMDGLERVKRHLDLPREEQVQCVRDFWDEIIQLPPDGVSALPPLLPSSPSPSSTSKTPVGKPSSLDPADPAAWASKHYTPVETMCTHNHRPPPTLAEGQAVFWRYAAQIFASLLHFSLAGGFAAERIMGVLHETGYLVGGPAAAAAARGQGQGTAGVCPVAGGAGGSGKDSGRKEPEGMTDQEKEARDQKERDRTYRRLLETTQAVMEYMYIRLIRQYDMTPITGAGWQSAVRVRMLHSAVRVRIADKRGVRNTYDARRDGVPVNQEDMLMTLGSFAVSPLRSLRCMGFKLEKEEEEAYIAAWRHVGFYLGISPSKLARHFSSYHRAERLSACATMHLFSYDATRIASLPVNTDSLDILNIPVYVDPKETPTYKLLLSTCHRPPFNRTIGESLCLARVLLGDGMADRLALPRQSWARRTRTMLGFRASRIVHAFGRVYVYRLRDLADPSFWFESMAARRERAYQWETDRVRVTRTLIGMVIWWQLGHKKARFTVNEHVSVGEETVSLAATPSDLPAGQEDPSVPSGRGNTEEPVGDEPEPYMLDPQGAQQVVRRFRGLMLEMGAVLLGLAGLGCVVGYQAWSLVDRYR